MHYKKDDLLNCWTSSSDISSYHTEFYKGHGTVGAGQGHSMAGERHGHGMVCVNPPLQSYILFGYPYIFTMFFHTCLILLL